MGVRVEGGISKGSVIVEGGARCILVGEAW